MDLKKKLQVVMDLVEKYLETGLSEDGLGSEKKYFFINKFGPKKCPGDQVRRSEIANLYSWQHYAPLQWFEHLKKATLEEKNLRDGKATTQKRCNACQAYEGTTIKHKVCSACKQVYYCSAECQKVDWKNGHKERCKELRKNMPK